MESDKKWQLCMIDYEHYARKEMRGGVVGTRSEVRRVEAKSEPIMAHVYDNAGLDARTTGDSGSHSASMAFIKHYTMAAHKELSNTRKARVGRREMAGL